MWSHAISHEVAPASASYRWAFWCRFTGQTAISNMLGWSNFGVASWRVIIPHKLHRGTKRTHNFSMFPRASLENISYLLWKSNGDQRTVLATCHVCPVCGWHVAVVAAEAARHQKRGQRRLKPHDTDVSALTYTQTLCVIWLHFILFPHFMSHLL